MPTRIGTQPRSPFMKLPTIANSQPQNRSPFPAPQPQTSIDYQQHMGGSGLTSNLMPRHIDLTRQMTDAQRGFTIRENQALGFTPPDWYADEWNKLPVDQQALYIGLPENFRGSLMYAKMLETRGVQQVNYNGRLLSPTNAITQIHKDIETYHRKSARQERHTERQIQRQPIPYRVLV